MKPFKLLCAALAVSSAASNAYALGAVSRACQFSTIPFAIQGVASAFFIALGAEPAVGDLSHNGLASRYWINEALTTDYFSARYYLYAAATVYSLRGSASTYYNKWQWYSEHVSPNWRADTISPTVANDSRFSIYFANRGVLYSARAGMAKVGEFIDPTLHQRFVVKGKHWYYDPVSKVSSEMRETRAQDCNLQNWGRDTGLWDR